MLTNLKLAPKFTLLLSLVFISAIAISGAILSQTTLQTAEADVAYKGKILMGLMNSVRTYTNNEINPLVAPRVETNPKFIPQSIPSYSVRQVFEILRQDSDYKDYFYKDAVLNPTNLRDYVDEFEVDLVKQFREDPNLKEVSGFRNRSGEEVFYYAQPITIKKQSCLRCHSTPETAPKSQLATYGAEHGFGWELNKVLGTQTIYVPSKEIFAVARHNLSLVMGIFIGIFALVILLINYLLKQAVIKPIRPMARLAQKISSEQFLMEENEEVDLASLEKVSKKSDELGQLARLFQQMAHSIYVREQSFAQQLQQLRNKSDQTQARTQAKTSEMAYLKSLQEKSKTIRSKTKGSS
jgi:methyl-accepting chemotaxis protein